ncbi:MAG: ABC transporter permease [Bulleidia sp.]
MTKDKFWQKPAFQTLMISLLCILIGLAIGFVILLMIAPEGAFKAITTIILNFLTKNTTASMLKALGNTLAKTAPLLMCALSICFCYKVGLFNIGAAGQYEAGAGAALALALIFRMPWYVCLVGAIVAGALLGVITGALKAYRNVNEVISGIMLNWITLYVVNTVLANPASKDTASPYTLDLVTANKTALLPSLGLGALFNNNRNVTIAIPLAAITAIIIWVVLDKTKFGYELKATGYNREAARYAGMQEKKNIIVTLAIGGALAGIGAAFMYLSGYAKWETTMASVPGMGFNGIAATFLGGLHPIGTIFSSFFIQNITDGGALIDRMLYPSQISDLISGVIIYLCGFVLFFRTIFKARPSSRKSNTDKAKGEKA